MGRMKKRTFLGFGVAGAEPFSEPNEEKFLADEVTRWTQVIKATGFKLQ